MECLWLATARQTMERTIGERVPYTPRKGGQSGMGVAWGGVFLWGGHSLVDWLRAI